MKTLTHASVLLLTVFLTIQAKADYDPSIQRWINQDPIGEAGGINLYQFVYNNPVNWFDPDGLIADGVIPPPRGYNLKNWPPSGWPRLFPRSMGLSFDTAGATDPFGLGGRGLASAGAGFFCSSGGLPKMGGYGSYGGSIGFPGTQQGQNGINFGPYLGGGFGCWFSNAKSAKDLEKTTGTFSLNMGLPGPIDFDFGVSLSYGGGFWQLGFNPPTPFWFTGQGWGMTGIFQQTRTIGKDF